MPISDGRTGKSFEELLNSPDIKDQFVISVSARLGRETARAQPGSRPHPIRAVLRQDVWRLPQGRGRQAAQAGRLDASPARRLGQRHDGQRRQRPAGRGGDGPREAAGGHDPISRAVRRHLQLPADRQHNRLSVHAFGAAIDINTQFSDYWEWSKGPNNPENGETGFPAQLAKFSSVTGSSGAPSGTTSTRCTSNIGRNSSRSQSEAGRSSERPLVKRQCDFLSRRVAARSSAKVRDFSGSCVGSAGQPRRKAVRIIRTENWNRPSG